MSGKKGKSGKSKGKGKDKPKEKEEPLFDGLSIATEEEKALLPELRKSVEEIVRNSFFLCRKATLASEENLVFSSTSPPFLARGHPTRSNFLLSLRLSGHHVYI